MPRGSSFILAVVLGIRKDQPTCVVAIRRRETNEEEQVAPRVVRQVAPPLVST
jgi:hypothetical protein